MMVGDAGLGLVLNGPVWHFIHEFNTTSHIYVKTLSYI